MAASRSNSSLIVTLLVALIAVTTLVYAKQILLPIALATLLAFILAPIVDRLEKSGLGRIPSVAVVVILSFLLLGALGWVVSAQVWELSRQLPQYKTNVVAKIRAVVTGSTTVRKVTSTLNEIGQELTGKQPSAGVTPPVDQSQHQTKLAPDDGQRSSEPVEVKVVELPPSPLIQVQSWFGPLVEPLTTAGIVVVLLLFMLIYREDQRNRLIRLFGAANLHTTTEAIGDAAERISRYLRMQFLINAGYGISVGIGLSIIGVPGAMMWGVLGFALRFLPYVGVWLGAAMSLAVSFAVSPGWTQPLLIIGWYTTLELLAANVLEPLLYGHSVGVSGMGIILAAIVWTWPWGPIGLVLAVPLTVCLVVLAQHIPQLRFITILFGDEPTLSLDERIYQRLLAFDEHEARELTTKYLATSTLLELYDKVLIPVLAMVERDRHADLLREDQVEFVQDSIEDVVEDLGESARVQKEINEPALRDDANDATSLRVLCIPLHDSNDRISTMMLAQLLMNSGFQVDVGSIDSLTNELVENVANMGTDVAVISVLPPAAPRQTRLLRKRLRSRYPTLSIIIGYWIGKGDNSQLGQFQLDANSRLATTISDALVAVRTAQMQAMSATAERPKV